MKICVKHLIIREKKHALFTLDSLARLVGNQPFKDSKMTH